MHLLFQFTAYFLIQSWLFTGVSLSPVKQPFDLQDHVQSDPDNVTKIEVRLHNTLLTEAMEDDSTDIDNHNILSRLRRSPHCESKKLRVWSHCLGRYFTKVYCRESHVACMPETGVPPKCKKNHIVVLGENGKACRVVKSCTCT